MGPSGDQSLPFLRELKKTRSKLNSIITTIVLLIIFIIIAIVVYFFVIREKEPEIDLGTPTDPESV